MSKDIRKREIKKPKKGGKKATHVDMTPTPQVEVLKVKGKKANQFPEDEDM